MSNETTEPEENEVNEEADQECGRQMVAAAFAELGEPIKPDDWDSVIVCRRLIRATAKAREVYVRLLAQDMVSSTQECDAVASAYYAWLYDLEPESMASRSVGGLQFSAFSRAMMAIKAMSDVVEMVVDPDGTPEIWGYQATELVELLDRTPLPETPQQP